MKRESWHHPCITLDVDGTFCPTRKEGESYADLIPFSVMVDKIRQYRSLGYYIILDTGRQMRTHDHNVGRINADTLPTLVEWLRKWEIPFDEIHIAKPWPGFNGFYVDDNTITPKQFLSMNPEEVKPWLATQKLE